MHPLERRAREHAEAGEGEEAVGFFERLVELRRKQGPPGSGAGRAGGGRVRTPYSEPIVRRMLALLLREVGQDASADRALDQARRLRAAGR